MVLIDVVVDRVRLGHPDDAAVDDLGGGDEADGVDLAGPERDQVGVGHRPEVVPLEAEVFEAEAALGRVGDEVGGPVLEVLDPAEPDVRLVDVDPGVREGLGAVDDQDDGQEVAVLQRLGRLDDLGRRGRVHRADQVADRQRREEVLADVAGQPPLRVAGDERRDGRAVVLDPDDAAVVVDGPPPLADLVAGGLPHLAGAEPGVLEAVDQGLDDLALPVRLPPMLFAFGFLSMFLIGGLTGIMLGAAPFDFQLSDSYFVVGHFHWVLIGGTLFGTFAGIYYWYPKVTGRMLSERLARWQFWLLYIGFILTFGPMHISGMLGMPRRIYTYEAGHGWEIWNQLSTIGALIQVPSYAIFVYNLVASLRKGKPAGDDPWDAWTLEWTTTSPPPSYNFEEVPTVHSRRPLWDLKHPDDPDWQYE